METIIITTPIAPSKEDQERMKKWWAEYGFILLFQSNNSIEASIKVIEQSETFIKAFQ